MPVALKQSLVPLVLVVPTVGFAIGLGDIHVESALNEPLSARIDIVSATPEDLLGLSAAIANREIFQRYGAERPAFLASARLKVTRDAQERPILQVTSSEPFTEPVVSLLVDLRWHNGELVREYPLLLDPPNFASRFEQPTTVASTSNAASSNAASSNAASSNAAPANTSRLRKSASTSPRTVHAAASSAAVQASQTTYRVNAHDTLHGIAHRLTSARSEIALQRTMIAVFRANPGAFDGNINRLHRGALLAIPPEEAMAAVSAQDARSEVQAQMSSWHHQGFFGGHDAMPALAQAAALARSALAASPAGSSTPVAAAPAAPAGSSAPLAAAPAAASRSTAAPSPALAANAKSAPNALNDSLEARIQTLERALSDTKRVLSSEHATLQSLQQYVAETNSPYPPTLAQAARAATPDAAPRHRLSTGAIWSLIGGAVALVLFTTLKWRAKRSQTAPKFPADTHEEKLAIVLADSPFAAEFRETAQAPAPSAVARDAAAGLTTPLPALAVPAPVKSSESAAVVRDDVGSVDLGATTVSLIIDGAVGEQTVNLGAPTQQIPVDTARLAALNDLERELEASYDPTATDVFEHVSLAELAQRRRGAATPTGAAVRNAAAAPTGAAAQGNAEDAMAATLQMPSKLTERALSASAESSLFDVLRKAIEADPRRLDLRLKLLERYFNSALNGHPDYVEVARKLSRNGETLSASDWEKLARLGEHDDSTAITREHQLPGKWADCA